MPRHTLATLWVRLGPGPSRRLSRWGIHCGRVGSGAGTGSGTARLPSGRRRARGVAAADCLVRVRCGLGRYRYRYPPRLLPNRLDPSLRPARRRSRPGPGDGDVVGGARRWARRAPSASPSISSRTAFACWMEIAGDGELFEPIRSPAVYVGVYPSCCCSGLRRRSGQTRADSGGRAVRATGLSVELLLLQWGKPEKAPRGVQPNPAER